MFDYQPSTTLLADRTLLVTGAGAGIGRACATAFAAHGARVILLGRSGPGLEAAHDEIEGLYPGRALLHPLDLERATAQDYAVLADAIERQFERLDGLLHNAGLLGARSPLQFYPDADWRQVMAVNLDAAFHLSKALLPALARSPDARLLFTSSSVGRKGRAYWGAYSVSKFAVEGLMQVLADELAETSSIRVNSLNPGGTRTAMRRLAYPAEDPASQPEPSALMPVYLYLMGPHSAAIHGQALELRGFQPPGAEWEAEACNKASTSAADSSRN